MNEVVSYVDKLKNVSKNRATLQDMKIDMVSMLGGMSLEKHQEILSMMESQDYDAKGWPFMKAYIRGNITAGGTALNPLGSPLKPGQAPAGAGGGGQVPSQAGNGQPGHAGGTTNTATQATPNQQGNTPQPGQNTPNQANGNTAPQQPPKEGKQFFGKFKNRYQKWVDRQAEKKRKKEEKKQREQSRYNTTGTWKPDENYGKPSDKTGSDDAISDENINYLDRSYSHTYRDSFEPIKDGKTLDTKIPDSDLYNVYENEHISKLPKETQNRVKLISQSILQTNNGPIKEKTIVNVPALASEEIGDQLKMIQELKKQKGDNFKAVVYVNGYGSDPTDLSKKGCTKADINKRVADLKSGLGGDKRFIIVGNYYDKRKPIGTIRADVADATILSMDQTTPSSQRVISFLDADTWKMDENYIQGLSDFFDKNQQVGFSAGLLRWSISDPANREFVWFSEVLSQLTNMLQDTRYEAYPSGATTSVRLSDFMKVKGFERSLWKGEDSSLGEKVKWFHGNDTQKSNNKGAWYKRRVYVDPKRGEQILTEGSPFHTQRTGDFNPVDKKKIDKKSLEERNIAIRKLINNQEVSASELGIIENDIERFIQALPSGYTTGIKDLQKKLPLFWNVNIGSKSLYRIIVENDKIKFVKK